MPNKCSLHKSENMVLFKRKQLIIKINSNKRKRLFNENIDDKNIKIELDEKS